MKEHYIHLALCRYLQKKDFYQVYGGEWFPLEDEAKIANAIIENAFRSYDISVNPDCYQAEAKELFTDLERNRVLRREGDEFTGEYLKFLHISPNPVDGLVANNPVNERINSLGDQSLQRALKVINEDVLSSGTAEDNLENQISSANLEIPASDRIITLGHNQISAIEDGADDFFVVLDKEWSEPNEPDDTSMALGKVRAGLQLVKASILELDLFRMSMIAGLEMLMDKYADHAIGAAAGQLLDLIIQQMGMK